MHLVFSWYWLRQLCQVHLNICLGFVNNILSQAKIPLSFEVHWFLDNLTKVNLFMRICYRRVPALYLPKPDELLSFIPHYHDILRWMRFVSLLVLCYECTFPRQFLKSDHVSLWLRYSETSVRSYCLTDIILKTPESEIESQILRFQLDDWCLALIACFPSNLIWLSP